MSTAGFGVAMFGSSENAMMSVLAKPSTRFTWPSELRPAYRFTFAPFTVALLRAIELVSLMSTLAIASTTPVSPETTVS